MNIAKFTTHLIQGLCTFVHVLNEAPAWGTIAMVILAAMNLINVNFSSLAYS